MVWGCGEVILKRARKWETKLTTSGNAECLTCNAQPLPLPAARLYCPLKLWNEM